MEWMKLLKSVSRVRHACIRHALFAVMEVLVKKVLDIGLNDRLYHSTACRGRFAYYFEEILVRKYMFSYYMVF